MCKRLISLLLTFMILFSLVSITAMAAESVSNPRQLKTLGNQFVYEDDPTTAVRLTGVNVPGGEWTGTPQVEKIDRSVKWAIDNWDCNLIRLPVSVNGWTGNYSYVYDGGIGYKNYIDSVIQIANEKGAYVILDLHHYRSFNNEQYLTFWQEAATKYANNPAVLFGILNEPTGTPWEVWRDGDGDTITGHQQVVEMIRDLGAKNIIVAGGLNYGYDLTGIADGYALVDQGSNNDESKAGYGIAYDAHIYNHKGVTATNWDSKTGATRKQYPVIIGEFGWVNNSPAIGTLPVKDPDDPSLVENWVPAILAWLDDDATYGSKASYAAYCMHMTSEPPLIENDGNFKNDDYTYPPTEKWGAPIKAHLEQAVTTRYSKVVINYGNFDDDEDASIDASDLQLFKLHLKGKKLIKNHHCPAADLDGDGYVDTADLQELKLYISKGRPFSVYKK